MDIHFDFTFNPKKIPPEIKAMPIMPEKKPNVMLQNENMNRTLNIIDINNIQRMWGIDLFLKTSFIQKYQYSCSL